MSIHVYRCEKCRKEQEIYFSRQEQVKEEIKCSGCRSKSKRIISTPARVELHGTGFYANDYPKGTSKGKAK